MTISSWLPFGRGDGAPMRLLCLPHAGAGATAYRAWATGLPDWVAACAVQPPGRETRMKETPFSEAGPLAEALAEAVARSLETPFAVFGHSTGAIVAFELCRRLRAIGAPEPEHLFVAGRRAPQITEYDSRLESLSVEQLTETLRAHGGTPDWVLSAPGMLRMIHPLLAADFAVSERYRYHGEPPLNVPITAFAADADPRADVAQVQAWQEQTAVEFRLCRLSGGHFAVLEQAERVHATIAEDLRVRQGLGQS